MLKALPLMASRASSAQLQHAMKTHLVETEQQVRRLQRALFEETLAEEKATDQILSGLAEGGLNLQAARGARVMV